MNDISALMSQVGLQGVQNMAMDTSGSWRDVRPEDLKKKNARSGISRMFAEAVLATDKVVGL